MPKVLVADWDAIKRDYLRGITPKILAAKHGVNYGSLRSRAHRERWMEHRAELVAKTEAKTLSVLNNEAAKPDAVRYVERVKARINQGLTVLEVNETTEVPQLERQMRVLETINRIARPTFGLDDGAGKGGKMTLNLSVLKCEPQRAEPEPIEAEILS